eukprot:COSAG03_NODE_9694_length_700_cov_0.921797_1_plen_197_part_10
MLRCQVSVHCRAGISTFKRFGPESGSETESSSDSDDVEQELDPRTKTTEVQKKQQLVAKVETDTATDSELFSAVVKDQPVKQLTQKDGRYKKGASIDLVLNVNQIGVKIFDGDQPLDTLRYAELDSWEFNHDTLQLAIIRNIGAGKTKDARGPAACKFICADVDQGVEIIGEMSKVAKLMAGQMKAATAERKAKDKR